MARKKREINEEITPSLLKFREKRKWQIAFRRYVLERNISSNYAPYFGLDIENIRKWFECQFNEGVDWSKFGVLWQFDHIIPVTYFDFNNEEELKLCWNFTNIRVEHFQRNKDSGNRLDVLAARGYFKKLFENTGYPVCQKLLHKIDQIELSEIVSTKAQESFILTNRDYLNMIENYSNFEFELLNTGRSVTEVEKEIGFIKNFKH